MNSSFQYISLADYYFEILQNLNPESKLDLISKLSQSLKEHKISSATTIESLFGAYQSDETAEEIITAIRSSRIFNRGLYRVLPFVSRQKVSKPRVSKINFKENSFLLFLWKKSNQKSHPKINTGYFREMLRLSFGATVISAFEYQF